jgi:tRNA-modifying protein YgfZ
MPTAHLADRALVHVLGTDAEPFLQNLITADVAAIGADEAMPGALLSPQGKILFDFLISRDGTEGFRLDCRADLAGDLQRRLMLYRLRAKVEITQAAQALVLASWENESAGATGPEAHRFRDRRFCNVAVERIYGRAAPSAEAERDQWDALRIAHGVAESGADYALGDAFPHDVLLDQNGGVGFRKGCFVGQEVVSRMQHRGTARRRILIAGAESDLPSSGTATTVDGRPVGSLGSVVGTNGLALARIDKVADAIRAGTPVLAEGVPLTFRIPDWALFTFPAESAPAAGEA